MDDVRTPIYAAEPYQESQGRESPNASSPDALMEFYKDMEQKEIVERKLSKRKSNSIWSRKSVKRSTAPAAPSSQKHHSQLSLLNETREKTRGEEDREMEKLEEQKDTVPQALNSRRSIIPDTAKDLPAWYNKDAWSSPLPTFKLRYNIHNPVGPRWYKNYHLIPPSQLKPATRPPSVFSPSFPPMAGSTLQDHEDLPRMPGPSRTPSNSPLPTPNSSETRVEDSGVKPRSRKTSQTAHDNVDLLDVTDPWGTNWHHQSPYDIGLSNGPISADVQDALQTRTRRTSVTAQSRRKAVTPSPLSQSTSAVHLHDLSAGAHIPRKLSKRRTPALGSIFGANTQQLERNAVSLPVTPTEGLVLSDQPSSVLPKRLSVADPHPYHNGTTLKKEKRGSVLGRLVRKFSILRKPAVDLQRGERDDNHTADTATDIDRLALGEQSILDKDQPDTTRRIPPPSLANPPPVKDNEHMQEADRSSLVSLETPFSIGRLTVTNPDVPGSSDNTPALNTLPLLPEKPVVKERSRPSPQAASGSSGPADSDPPISVPGPRRTSISSANTLETQPPAVPDKTPPAPALTISGGKEKGSSEASATVLSIGSPRPPSPDVLSHAPLQKPKAVSTNTVRSYTHINPSSKGDIQPERLKASMSSVIDFPKTTSSAKPTGPPNERPLPDPEPAPSPSIPFPASEASHSHIPPAGYFSSCDYSPLSASSILANPPTPHNSNMPIPPSPKPLPTPLPPPTSQDRKHSSREPSPTSQTVRQTETFKLVRSSSNHVYASTETIVAGGQQWEVVESVENKSKGRASSKPNDRESGSRREQRREGRHAGEGNADVEDRTQVRGHRSYRSSPGEHIPQKTSAPAVDSFNERSGTSKSVRKKEEGSRSSGRKRSPSNVDMNKPQPVPPPNLDAPSARQLERQPSTSVRPTSELASAAEMNALRAKEAWDMERLWKARSAYGNDSHGFNPSTTIPLTMTDEKGAQADIHGSSHTAFVVQSPFQSQPSHIYHSMPAIPTSILYSSSIPTSSQPSHHRSSKHSLQSFDPKIASATTHLTNNPLPEPPRASSYEPVPLTF